MRLGDFKNNGSAWRKRAFEVSDHDFRQYAEGILSSLAAGIGGIGKAGVGPFFGGLISALIGWFVWAYLTYIIGTKILPMPQTRADYGELLRTIGFSSSPGLIRVLSIIPCLSKIVFMLAGI